MMPMVWHVPVQKLYLVEYSVVSTRMVGCYVLGELGRPLEDI